MNYIFTKYQIRQSKTQTIIVIMPENALLAVLRVLVHSELVLVSIFDHDKEETRVGPKVRTWIVPRLACVASKDSFGFSSSDLEQEYAGAVNVGKQLSDLCG